MLNLSSLERTPMTIIPINPLKTQSSLATTNHLNLLNSVTNSNNVSIPHDIIKQSLGIVADNFSTPLNPSQNNRKTAFERHDALRYVFANYRDSDNKNPFIRIDNNGYQRYHRVYDCCVKPTPIRNAELRLDSDGRAHIANMQVCENPHCPLCAPLRSEIESRVLVQGISNAGQAGYELVFVSLTRSHNYTDKLTDTLAGLKTAWHGVTSGMTWQALSSKYQLAPIVKRIEVTYGANGYHPHIHALFAIKCDDNGTEGFINALKARWEAQLSRLGIYYNEHAFDAREGHSAIADYIAKFGREPLERVWGVESEITRTNLKAARKGVSLMQVLDVIHRAVISRKKPTMLNMDIVANFYLAMLNTRTVEGIAKFCTYFGIEDVSALREEIKSRLLQADEDFVILKTLSVNECYALAWLGARHVLCELVEQGIDFQAPLKAMLDAYLVYKENKRRKSSTWIDIESLLNTT